MTSHMGDVSSRDAVAEIRGRMVSLTVLELFSADLVELNRKLEAKAAQAPEFFRNAPLLLDFTHLEEEVGAAWLAGAYRILIDNHFIPVGIAGGSKALEEAAGAQQIAIWPSSRRSRQMVEEWERKPDHQEDIPEESGPESLQSDERPQTGGSPQTETGSQTDNSPEEPVTPETLVIYRPVRSGQKIYARGADLIVLASVSTGAEILADGHIHVYGSLRGRAIAGAQGMKGARIFCRDLQADLVAIAGFYLTNEDLPEDKCNQAVQIYLRGEQLFIDSL